MAQGILLAMAVMSLLVGVPLARWSSKLARWSEVLDAIGRKPAGEVEPADWKVLLYRVLGIALVITGVILAILFVI